MAVPALAAQTTHFVPSGCQHPLSSSLVGPRGLCWSVVNYGILAVFGHPEDSPLSGSTLWVAMGVVNHAIAAHRRWSSICLVKNTGLCAQPAMAKASCLCGFCDGYGLAPMDGHPLFGLSRLGGANHHLRRILCVWAA